MPTGRKRDCLVGRGGRFGRGSLRRGPVRKLPNRRRIAFSNGRVPRPPSQLSAVGSEPCSATNLRRAATDSAIRVSATSVQWNRLTVEYAGWVRIVGT
jgi:hypothetical protein